MGWELRSRRHQEILSAFASPAEQTEIFDEIERRLSIVDEIGDQVEANLKRAARLRQGILKRAFEGRLVPQDPGPPHQNRWTGTNG